jgi:hypothetical protein
MYKLGAIWGVIAAAGCAQDPVVVASNENPLEINKVDILLVVDNSGSARGLEAALPELLDELIAGSEEPGHERPKLTDLHLAVVSTDMGLHGIESVPSCQGSGDDGIFIAPSQEQLEECSEASAILAYEEGVATASTTETLECLPMLGIQGCGFEQPLEAMLKSMWPGSDDSIEFLDGTGHGEDANEGFLREDSLLVVIIATDEDDCSLSDPSILDPRNAEPGGLNTRCAMADDEAFEVERYVDGLRSLRDGDAPVLFVVVGGIPPELVNAEAQGEIDFEDPSSVDAYYDNVLDAPAMQVAISDQGTIEGTDDDLVPSCTDADGEDAYPPRRLVEVAKSFGSAGVLGSLCAEDYAETIGAVIRATAERL